MNFTKTAGGYESECSRFSIGKTGFTAREQRDAGHTPGSAAWSLFDIVDDELMFMPTLKDAKIMAERIA